MRITQSVVNDLALKHLLAPSHLERGGRTKPTRFYLTKDLPEMSLRAIAVVSCSEQADGPVKVSCSLQKGLKTIVVDGDQPYASLDVAIAASEQRLGKLLAQYADEEVSVA